MFILSMLSWKRFLLFNSVCGIILLTGVFWLLMNLRFQIYYFSLLGMIPYIGLCTSIGLVWRNPYA